MTCRSNECIDLKMISPSTPFANTPIDWNISQSATVLGVLKVFFSVKTAIYRYYVPSNQPQLDRNRQDAPSRSGVIFFLLL